MIVKTVKLTNFRNHTHYTLDCNKDTSLIIGKNGCGKTSVLEAIYILMRGKSFRASDPEILKRGAEFYRIELDYQNGETIIATYNGKEKNFLILDKKSKRLPKKYKYPIILFLPSDLNLISHSPGCRRDYFDTLFSELSEEYSAKNSQYKKALKQRNEILKNESPTREALFSWNILLAKLGTSLLSSRQQFINQINFALPDTYHSIAENDDTVTIEYSSELNGITENTYFNQLEQNFQKDAYLGHTCFGIHRDDYLFKFNNSSTNGSASRGETRSIILALKFIEAELIETILKKKPLILLDDVFSELDEARRSCLVKNFQNHQVIITSVETID